MTPSKSLEHKLFMRSLSQIGGRELAEFHCHWKTQVVEETRYSLVYRLQAQQGLWDKWLGQPQGLEIRLTMPPIEGRQPEFTELTVHIQAFGGDRGVQMLRVVGLELIRSLRNFLQACPERRQHLRWNCRQPLRVYPVFPDLELAEPIAGMASDISLEGISLRVPQRPTTSYFYVHFNTSEQLARWVMLARVVRIEAQEDGWFDVGATFPASAETSLTPTNGRRATTSDYRLAR